MKNWLIIAFLTIFCSAALICFGAYFGYNNEEISLRAQAEAQKDKIEGVHDKMWKVIQQKAQVSNEYKNAFVEIYPQIIAGRYSANGDGSLMKWVTEQNPNFDTALYKDLMQSIEVLRSEFQRSQEMMIDIVREHTTLCSTYPARWFITNKSKIKYTIISSTKSKTVVETGIDDDVNLF